jgi:DNA-binding transcriptional ArsR family regulator
MAKHESRLDLLFAALGDPTRRAILDRLARGEATVTELAAPHEMALPSFLKHLNRLEEAGLIQSEKRGRIRSCRLAPDAFRPAREWLAEQQTLWECRLDRLEDYATKLMRMRNDGAGPQN